jgi:hypothetical protein
MFKTFYTLWITLLIAAEWLLVAAPMIASSTFPAASRTKKAAKGEESLSITIMEITPRCASPVDNRGTP